MLASSRPLTRPGSGVTRKLTNDKTGWNRHNGPMNKKDKYPYVPATRKACAALKISPQKVLRRAGLPPDSIYDEEARVTAAEHYAIWHAIMAEAKQPGLPLVLGKAQAHVPYNVAVYAFSCSPNLELGAGRLALFKPLVGPIGLEVDRQPNTFGITFTSSDPDVPLPSGLGAFEVAYFVELVRILTAENIVPLSVSLTAAIDLQSEYEEHLGTSVKLSNTTKITFSREDAQRPFVSANAELWAGFQETLTARLLERDRDALMSARVKKALLEILPSGRSSVEHVCDRLHVSKRSLQRHLKTEGQTFQAILDSTRSELSMQYLAQEDISVEEISYLLAFRDPNSFYRAFRNWTGMTPMEARGQSTH